MTSPKKIKIDVDKTMIQRITCIQFHQTCRSTVIINLLFDFEDSILSTLWANFISEFTKKQKLFVWLEQSGRRWCSTSWQISSCSTLHLYPLLTTGAQFLHLQTSTTSPGTNILSESTAKLTPLETFPSIISIRTLTQVYVTVDSSMRWQLC